MFSRRERAGYLFFPVPHPLDARILAAVTTPRLRDKMGPEDVEVLAVFGHRMAEEAVRTASIATLKEGFLGVAAAAELNGDFREVLMALSVLFHSAGLLHVTDMEVITWVTSFGFSQQARETIRQFTQRPEQHRSIAAMRFCVDGEREHFRYVRC